MANRMTSAEFREIYVRSGMTTRQKFADAAGVSLRTVNRYITADDDAALGEANSTQVRNYAATLEAAPGRAPLGDKPVSDLTLVPNEALIAEVLRRLALAASQSPVESRSPTRRSKDDVVREHMGDLPPEVRHEYNRESSRVSPERTLGNDD